MARAHDVVVIGGGIVGAACAYTLAAAGLDVALVERSGLAAGTSHAGQGGLGFGLMSGDLERSMQLLGMAAYRAFVSEGHDIGYRPGGALVLTATDHADAVKARTVNLEQRGLPVEWVDSAELHDAEPGVGSAWVGAALIRDAPVVFPMRVVHELARGARERGASVNLGAGDAQLETRRGRVEAVRTRSGRLIAGAVVVAAGVWTPALVSDLGIRAPISCVKGHVLVIETDGIMLRHQITEAAYEFTARDPDQVSRPGPTFATVLEQMTDATILAGSSREPSPLETHAVTARGAVLAARAIRAVPGIAQCRVIRMYAGLRPQTPDGLAMLGPTAVVQGLWFAAGHGGEGVNQAIVSGQLITALMAGRTPPVDPAPFMPDRFNLVG